MCGFVSVHGRNLPDHINYAEFLEYRGPSSQTISRRDGWHIYHALLAVNGEVPQPVGNLWWNGEIYLPAWYIEFSNDTLYLEQYLSKFGSECFEHHRGEFAICWWNNPLLHVITDAFGTKPIYWSVEHGSLGIATYPSALKRCGFCSPLQVPANTHITFDCSDDRYCLSEDRIFAWDWEPCHRTFDYWCSTFDASIKRMTHVEHPIFVGLSSGYDSGAICASLLHQEIPFAAYSLRGCENHEVLAQRVELLKAHGVNHTYVEPVLAGFRDVYADFAKTVEPYSYQRIPNNSSKYRSIYMEWGAVANYLVGIAAKTDGCLIGLSGQGGDDIYADYAYPPNRNSIHSEINGDYTGWRRPWRNFAGGHNQSFLGLVERVGGALGQEARYPLLDTDVVQAFLWLDDDLKNREYKAPLANYMRIREFPFSKDEKTAMSFIANDAETSRQLVECYAREYEHGLFV